MIQTAYNIESMVLAEDVLVDILHSQINASFTILFVLHIILMEDVPALLQVLLQQTLLNSLTIKTLSFMLIVYLLVPLHLRVQVQVHLVQVQVLQTDRFHYTEAN